MTEKLMETACARLCLLTPIAWDESMPPLFSRMAVRRMMECGALSGLDPWDIWCGNGWIVRRWPGPRFDGFDRTALKDVLRAELGGLRQG